MAGTVEKLFSLAPSDRPVLRVIVPLFAVVTAANVLTVSFARALYISHNPYESLPWMFIGASTFTAVASLIYVTFIGRWALAKRFEGLVLVAVVSFCVVGFVVPIDPAGLSLLAFTWCAGLGQLLLIQAWGYSTALLPVRQARRLFPVLAASATVGAAVGGAMTSAVLPLGGLTSPLFAAVGLLGIGLTLVRTATRRLSDSAIEPGTTGKAHTATAREASSTLMILREQPTAGKKTAAAPKSPVGAIVLALRSLRDIPLLRSLALLVFLIQASSVVMDFQFSAALKEAYDADSMASFLGLYYAGANVLTFFVALIAGNRIARVLGIGVAAASGAAVLVTGSLIAIITGFTGTGMVAGIVIATSFGERVVGFGVSRHALNAALTPVDARVAERAKFLIDGVGHRIATVLVSVALLFVGSALADYAKLSPVVLLLGACALLLGFRLGPVYLTALVDGLRERRIQQSDSAKVRSWAEREATRTVQELLESGDPESAHRGLDMAEELDVPPTDSSIEALLGHGDPGVVAHVLHSLTVMGREAPRDQLGRHLDPETPVNLLRSALRALPPDADEYTDQVQKLVDHPDPLVECLSLIWLRKSPDGAHDLPTRLRQRRPGPWTMVLHGLDAKTLAQAAPMPARTAGGKRAPRPTPGYEAMAARGEPDLVTKLTDYLLSLPSRLAAADSTTRREALDAIAMLRLPSMVPPLLEALESPISGPAAMTTLIHLGADLVLPAARQRLEMGERISRPTRIRLLRLVERLKGGQLVAEQLDAGDTLVRHYAILSLWRLAREDDVLLPPREDLMRRAAREVEVLVLLACVDAALAGRGGDYIRLFRGEVALYRARSETRTFRLLGLVYQRRSLHRAYLHYTSPHKRTRSNAIELLDASIEDPELRSFVAYVEATEHAEGRSYTADIRMITQAGLHEGFEDEVPDAELIASLTAVDGRLGSMYRWAAAADRRSDPSAPEGDAQPATAPGSRPEIRMDRVFLLRSMPLFEEVPADQLLAVAEICEEVGFATGDMIIREGQPGDHLYLIVDGRVEVLRGKERVAVLGAREWFGEMALLDRTVRSASVRALEDVDCLILGRDDFEDLLDVSPSLAKGVIRVLSRRLRGLMESG